ncbi:MAG: endonuclease III [Planctomycetes bacterium]|nr:endonuclease III [Planctomycetota bacterium]
MARESKAARKGRGPLARRSLRERRDGGSKGEGAIPLPLKDRAARIVAGLAKAYPDAECALRRSNPLELLVATILSAQCTDKQVNVVTGPLFRKYRSARDYARAKPGELERAIRSTGFFRNKAKAIRGACRILDRRHGGRVPDRMEDLLELPGVARKTANCVLGTAFGKAEGVVVDTHVMRIARRLELTSHGEPAKIEKDLMELLPRSEWILFAHRMIWHGRRICGARRPRCEECPIACDCPYPSRRPREPVEKVLRRRARAISAEIEAQTRFAGAPKA